MSARAAEALAYLEAAMTVDSDECIIWPYSVSRRGYGRVRYGGRPREVHRLACEWAHGPCPPGRQAAHGPCHDRLCFNPKHLRWATNAENSHDRFRDGTLANALGAHDVQAIRRAWVSGRYGTQTALAAAFGVAVPTVNHIIHRRRWKDVP